MTRASHVGQGIISLALLALWLGCKGESSAPGDGERHIEGLLVSSAFRASGPASGAGTVAYVSMVPGTARKGATMSVRNQSSGASTSGSVVDGGLDPVAVAAIEGDDLSITVTDSTGRSTTSVESVKQRRPPRVVRTQPIPGSVDVPLNVRVTLVFSGPIDPATVDSDAITLLQAGRAVSGTPSLSSDGLMLSWTPRSPLAVATSYVVVLSPTLEDLNGLPVTGFVPVDFMTGASAEGDYGAVEIEVRTSGTPIQVVTDPVLPSSGWALTVGGIPTPFRISPDDTVTIGRIPEGQYELNWTYSPNCAPHASVPARVTVTAGGTAHLTAIFTCEPWPAMLQARITSTGVSIPATQNLVFRSQGFVKVLEAAVPANGTALIPLPDPAKQYQVSVNSSNDQCRTTPTTQDVVLKFSGVSEMKLDIVCNTPSSLNAAIEVTSRTTGQAVTSLLWRAYPTSITLSRAGGDSYVIDILPNDTALFREYATLVYLIAGTHTVTWNYLPPNCVGGANPPPFEVVDGQVAHVTVTAACGDWSGRLQINALRADTTTYGGSAVFRIDGGGLPSGTVPETVLWQGGSGTVPLPYGEYTIWLDPNQSSCRTTDGLAQHVRVTEAGASVSFGIRCAYDPSDW